MRLHKVVPRDNGLPLHRQAVRLRCSAMTLPSRQSAAICDRAWRRSQKMALRYRPTAACVPWRARPAQIKITAPMK
ncbi:hypothetical protein ELE36_19045 [Pseudolysobacter antarcticus]|uniref:Uncharacterized protein n=1 Tax=Pseudolysobacter antarcticus TaxID=2511995 RepID=A0A411HP98_9GAMM|nr:hypothetical protein ELE36_19045 [Pseudolysobacter antarcticus]